MPGFGLRRVLHREAARLELLQIRFDARRRVQRVLTAVHDEERLVREVVREERAAQAQIAVAQHHDEAVERQETRVGRGVAHGDVAVSYTHLTLPTSDLV